MSVANQVNALRTVCVLLGGPFAPQRAIQPQPVACALLCSRPRLADAVGAMHSIGSASVDIHEAVGHHG